MKKKRMFYILDCLMILALTVYALLDTFLIPQEYQTVEAHEVSSEIAAETAETAGTAGDGKLVDIDDAEARLARFAPFIERMFPEVKDGIIE